MGKTLKRVATVSLVAMLTLGGCASLTACKAPWDKDTDQTYSDLIDKREDLQKQLKEVEDQLDEWLSRNKEVSAVKESVDELNRLVQYEEIDGPATLSEIDRVTKQIEEVEKDSLITESEANSMRKSLEDVKKAVFYSVSAQGIENRVESDPIMEVREIKSDGVTVREQSAADFGALQFVSNQVSTEDMLFGHVTTIGDGLQRDCVLGESYKEENASVSKKAYVDAVKQDMKDAIYGASELSYDINEGYKVVSTAEYDGRDLDTTIVFDVDDKGRLETIEQTFTKNDETVAEIGVEYSSISSSKFSTLFEKAEKTLDQQKAILDGSSEKGEE